MKGKRWKRSQAWAAHRFNRNASEHALENCIVNRKSMYTRPEIAIMLYAIFPLLLHSLMRQLDRLGMIGEMQVDTLFVYQTLWLSCLSIQKICLSVI